MIDCGIVGFGEMGRIRAEAIESCGGGRVAPVYDVVPPESTPYATASSAEEVIQSKEVHAVLVCTPNYLIPTLCKQALSAGKHISPHKTPGYNAGLVREVIEVERSAPGRKLLLRFQSPPSREYETIPSSVIAGVQTPFW